MEEGLLLMQPTYKTYEIKSSLNRTPWTMNFGHYVRMEEPKDRLREAMMRAGFKTPTEAANAYKRQINKNTLTSHLNGNRSISRKAAETYATIFGAKAGWLLYDEEGPRDVDVPLLSRVAAGNLRLQHGIEPHDVERYIKVGELPKGDWIALEVDGDSMDRIAPDGAILLVDRADDKLLDGRYYVFSLGGGEATFKRYRRSPPRMQPFSTNPDHMSIPADNDDLYVIGRAKRVIHDI
jgi:SOS-response transcriptional repressor LexA